MSDFTDELSHSSAVTAGGSSRDSSGSKELEPVEPEMDEHEQELRDYKDIKINTPSATKVAQVQEVLTEQGITRTHIRARKSAFVHNLIYLDGQKFDFTGREYLIPIYDKPDKQILLKTARQVEKSTFLVNNLVIGSVCIPYNKSLYVSPSHTQTRQFSNEKLRATIEGSPLISKYFQDTKVSHQVFEKGFTNGSYCFLRSAFRSADRARGISARDLSLDEIQDMYISEIPVIMECTSHFPDANVLMAGTPKSLDNPIEVYWNNTTQNEWLVKCEGCKHWNFLDDTNVAATEMYENDKLPPGPVCNKCSHPLDVAKNGQWMSLSTGKQIAGYRIPQLMVPWIIGHKDQWLKLLWKRDNYPIGQFYNEVLGLSYDLASKPITRAELIECCSDYKLWRPPFDQETVRKARKMNLIGGIDWGEGNDGAGRSPSGKPKAASYTVFTIGHYVNPKQFKVLFAKKYMGKEIEPDYIVKDVVNIVKTLGVKLLGVDWGHGWGVNNQLVRALGSRHVVQFQYLPRQRERMKWDPIGFKYQIQRNINISELFVQMKNKRVIFPKWKEIEPVAKDILSIYTEFDEYQKEMKYDHRQSDPDDFFHSLLYAKMAGDIYLGRPPR